MNDSVHSISPSTSKRRSWLRYLWHSRSAAASRNEPRLRVSAWKALLMGKRERVNRLRVKDEPSKLPFFPARILSKDGVVVGEHVPVWIHVFWEGHQERWDGSFEVPAIQCLPYHSTYTLRLADGRQGTIIHITPIIRGENLTVYFEGSGPLAQKHEGDGEACRRP